MVTGVTADYQAVRDWAVSEAITYAAKRGATVINLSLAGANLGSYVETAVNFATSRGARRPECA